MLEMMAYFECVMCLWAKPFFNGKVDWSKIRETWFNTVHVSFLSLIDCDKGFKWKGSIIFILQTLLIFVEI